MSHKPKQDRNLRIRPARRVKRGFALIVTLSLMMLLVIVAVGLLGLSSISLRGSAQGQAKAQAEANARLALQMAIGELQKSLGPDQRISARSSLIHGASGESNIVGAWESWQWDPFGSSGANYSDKRTKFQKWLVSSPNPDDAANISYAGSAPKNPIWLMKPVQGGTSTTPAGEPPTQLRASMVTVRNSSKQVGGMAWGVMDESLKAPIHLPEGTASPNPATNELAWRTAPPRSKPEIVVSKLAPSATLKPENLYTLPTAVVATESDSEEILGRQGDFTTASLGLQTDVVRGGFKKDLTTAFESSANLGNLFGNAMVYGTANEGGLKWDFLRSHYQLYKKTTAATTGQPKVAYRPGDRELRPASSGLDRSPAMERLLPVVAKLQLMFSIVTHVSHVPDRVQFFNQYGPGGNNNYGCPHLVYDPVVTLYNPYDVAIELPKLRVRIWDPPVLFGFKKNGNWLRDEFAASSGNGFQGLARFQIANERNPSARRYFTLLLTEKTSTTPTAPPGKTITMQPGEVKVFAPWVENNWTWGFETTSSGDSYKPRVFFDWNAANNFGNVDGRSTAPAALRAFGVQGVPGWDPRAGLQTDHLSYTTRPQATRYDFEIARNWNGGWLGIKRQDSFSAYAKPGRTVTVGTQPDFAVDILAGQVEQTTSDILRSYNFRFNDVEGEISGKSPAQIIERTFLVDDLMQLATDNSSGGKSPFAILTMSAKTTKQVSDNWQDVAMPWLFNHPVVEGCDTNTNMVGNALDSYDLRFDEVRDFNTFPGIEMEGHYGFYGATVTANDGVSNVPMFRVPLLPANSLGDLIPANLSASAALPRVTRPFGASRAHPLIPADSVARTSPVSGTGRLLDHSYLLNNALWDSTFFSTVGTFSGGLAQPSTRGNLLREFLNGESKLLNPRFVPIVSTRTSASTQASDLDKLSVEEFMNRIGTAIATAGAFNINSDSVTAWRAVLSSLKEEPVRGWKNFTHDVKKKTAFPRAGLPLGGDADSNASGSIDVKGQVRWAGFRALEDKQIDALAEAIVEEIRRRATEDQAPNLSLAEFVNRRVGSPTGTHTLYGLLETAIKAAGINTHMLQADSLSITGNEPLHASALKGLALPDARIGMTAEGAPSVITQGDLLMPLAGVMTVRGDTFRIRACGEARDGTGNITARAWCEAVVQRLPEYIDPADEAEKTPDTLSSEANKAFGRRFVITSFRWLDSDEV